MNSNTPTAKTLRNRRKRQRRAARRRAVAQELRTVQRAVNPPSPNRGGLRRGGRRAQRNRQTRGRSGNPYLNTLLHPEQYVGQKVPDVSCWPSATASISYDNFYTVTSSGAFQINVSPCIDSGLQLLDNPHVSWAGHAPGDWPGQPYLSAVFDRFRPVSGHVSCEFAGDSMHDGGMLVAIPWVQDTHLSGNVDFILSRQNSFGTPLRNGIDITWRPMDNTEFEYHSFSDSGFEYGEDGSTISRHYPALSIQGTGLTEGQVIKIRAFFNIECIPSQDTSSIVTVEPSPVNVAALKNALNSLQGMPFGQMLTTAAVGIIGMATHQLNIQDAPYGAFPDV
jgi:hypothetical protein